MTDPEEQYPDAPGFKEETTSRDAAIAETEHAGRLRTLIHEMFRAGEHLTADECAERLRESVLSVRPRLSELRAVDAIEPSGVRRKNRSGHSAIVWKIRIPPPARLSGVQQYLFE